MQIYLTNVSMFQIGFSSMQHGLFTCIKSFQKHWVTHCNIAADTLAKKWLVGVCSKVSDVSNIIEFLLKHYQKVFGCSKRMRMTIDIGLQKITRHD